MLDDIKRDIARGEIFRITRIAQNYEQSEMASLLGISKSMFSLLERAKRRANDKILNKYLDAFGVERQVFDEIENEVMKILFNKDVEMIRVIFLVVGMLCTQSAPRSGIVEDNY